MSGILTSNVEGRCYSSILESKGSGFSAGFEVGLSCSGDEERVVTKQESN